MDKIILSAQETNVFVTEIPSPVTVSTEYNSIEMHSNNLNIQLVSQERQVVLAQGQIVIGGGSGNSYFPSGW